MRFIDNANDLVFCIRKIRLRVKKIRLGAEN